MIDPLGAVDHQLLDQLRSAPGGRLTAQQLRHRLSWRIPARLANSMLNRLAEQNYITIAPDGYIYPRAGN
jgi:hypothetical protein